ncbi:hypothetical protein GLOIN_2v1763573 [Rhizophagus clarus]|uniref:TLDc domain-containing protein n=1 Tax=Rhizophagus clarus TaxID=94130 RepID=A0A8H3LV31_9GLOM|nr:hypothetical protein GLOIN_2v1763573 [Rhizophagus clarus]
MDGIVGGYNPLKWQSSDTWGITNDSFIFLFKSNNIKESIISNVENAECTLNYHSTNGPYFENRANKPLG